MVAVNTVIEFRHDDGWTPGVVLEESASRLVVAVNGDRSRRAYLMRCAATWRTVPKQAKYVKSTARRRAIVQAHSVFARQ